MICDHFFCFDSAYTDYNMKAVGSKEGVTFFFEEAGQ